MLRFKKHKKKAIAFAVSAISLSLVGIGVVNAEGGSIDPSGYLAQIAANTAGILDKVNNLPAALESLSTMALSLTKSDTSTFTSTFQGSANTLGKQLGTSLTNQNTSTDSLIQDYFQGYTQNNLAYANDLSFDILLNKPVWTPDPRGTTNVAAQYNYLKNASGLYITHLLPNQNWKGTNQDKATYDQYFRTMVATQTLNGNLLSQLSADMTAGLSATEQSLLAQATDSGWLATVASQELGVVVRQLLLFSSQSYVLQLQLLQTERELLAAQAAGNSIAVANSLGTENILLMKAVKQMNAGM